MGYQNNEAFERAAADLHQTMDAATNGSPIGAAAAEVSENGQAGIDEQSEGEPAFELTGKGQAYVGGFFSDILGGMIAHAQAEANEAENAEIVDNATDFYTVARTLTNMSTSAEAFADQLELEGMGDIAEFVRGAAKQVRKGAKLSREHARAEMIVLADI